MLRRKLMTAMAKNEARHFLSGTVQVKDLYLGDKPAGGKFCRGLENKIPFVAAASINNPGIPPYVEVTSVLGFTSDAISKWALTNLAPCGDVFSYGLACFAVGTEADLAHLAEVVGHRKPRGSAEVQVGQNWVGKHQDDDAGRLQGLSVPQVRKSPP